MTVSLTTNICWLTSDRDMKKVYLDNACTGIPPPQVLACAGRFNTLLTDPAISAGDVNRKLRGYMDAARAAVASLIHCSLQEVALVESTSHALGMLANAIPMEPGDNVLVCDLEYQASAICWKRRQEKTGIEVRRVPSRHGTIGAEDFERCMDGHSRVILIAAVQEINGFRADIAGITRMAHRHGCLVIVDGIQEVGAMAVDVGASGVDFYCAGGKKWLCNPYGMGFLYIRKDLLNTVLPEFYSYFNIMIPETYNRDYITYLEDPARTPFDDYTIVKDASSFEIGGYSNYLGALGLTAAIDVLQNAGVDAVENRIRGLAVRLLAGLEALGVTVSSPTDARHLSSIVTFHCGLRNRAALEKQIEQYLQRKNIYVSLRCSTGTGGIRVSIHYYNNEAEVDALLEALGHALCAFGRT